MIDVLFVGWNRLEFTKLSFQALLDNTNWNEVNCLYVHDDGSEDGTGEYLRTATYEFAETQSLFDNERLVGPVAATNWYLDISEDDPDTFAKIDNDFVVCTGWLDAMLEQHYLNPDIDLYGFEPIMGKPGPVDGRKRTLTKTRHIGGKGLIRKRAFERSGCRPHAHGVGGYQGFTQWQERHPDVKKAWITPDLPCFGLDQLPFEPWQSLTAEYVEKGWQRKWQDYEWDASDYWDWWLNDDPERQQL